MKKEPVRQTVRLQNYDYASNGMYFVTVCTQNRKRIFGDILENIINLNQFGIIAENEWYVTEQLRTNVEMGEFIVMPNHIHGVLIVKDNLNIIDTARALRATPARCPPNLTNTLNR